jgi:hypothetical protein
MRQGRSFSDLLFYDLLVPALHQRQRPSERRKRAPWRRSEVWQRATSTLESERQWLQEICPDPFYREWYQWIHRYSEYSALHVLAGLPTTSAPSGREERHDQISTPRGD